MEKIGRKIYHVLGGLGLVALYAYLGRDAGLCALLGVFVFATAVDMLRLKTPAFNEFMYRRFRRFIRDSERGRLTGSPWYALGVLCAVAFYDLPVAAYAVAFLAIGDVSATTVGERWGSIKISGVKSLQGTAAFVAASLAAGLLIDAYAYPMGFAVFGVGAVVAALVELVPLGVDDNLTVPIVSGGVMKLMLLMLG